MIRKPYRNDWAVARQAVNHGARFTDAINRRHVLAKIKQRITKPYKRIIRDLVLLRMTSAKD